MRCLVIEDEPHWQTTIAQIIAGHGSLELVGICPNLADALSAIRSTDYEMLIADLGLPDGSGIDAIRSSRRLRSHADILVATVFDDERSVVSAICAGATGYLVKDSTAAEWVAAIEQLRGGHSPLSPKVARHILRHLQEPARARRMGLADGGKPAAAVSAPASEESVTLTPRESEVLQLVAKGFSLVEVAKLLHVRTHHHALPRQEHLRQAGSEFARRSRVRGNEARTAVTELAAASASWDDRANRRFVHLLLPLLAAVLPILLSYLAPVAPTGTMRSVARAEIVASNDPASRDQGAAQEVSLPDAWDRSRRGFGGTINYQFVIPASGGTGAVGRLHPARENLLRRAARRPSHLFGKRHLAGARLEPGGVHRTAARAQRR